MNRGPSWKWLVCGMLLLASAINYMDRQTLANAGRRITIEFQLSQEQFGKIEGVFAYGFVVGSVVFGWLADRMSVRWLYAFVLAMWSLAGFATGFAGNYGQMLWCRFALGLFEAGHWPCGVRTTRMLLDSNQRSLGNSVLQSGTSIGAIITPQIMKTLMTPDIWTWRISFRVVGAIGLVWLVLWLLLIRKTELAAQKLSTAEQDDGPSIWRIILSRRMWIVFFVVSSINITFQILRVWLPKFLQEARGYTEDATLNFTSTWYIATDVGCIGAGALAVWLARRWGVHGARLIVFAICAVLAASCAVVPFLPNGPVFFAVLLVVGAGSLGVFPIYHAFTQDISEKHQGKITGLAGVFTWMVSAQVQPWFGALADESHRLHGAAVQFDTGLIIAAFFPLLAAIPLWLWWEKRDGENVTRDG